MIKESIAVILFLGIVLMSGLACGTTEWQLASIAEGQGEISPSTGTFPDGDEITLTALPASGWSFDHWGGHISGSENPITITINSDKTIYAYFISATTPTPTPTPTPTFSPTPTLMPTPTIIPTSTLLPTPAPTSTPTPTPTPTPTLEVQILEHQLVREDYPPPASFSMTFVRGTVKNTDDVTLASIDVTIWVEYEVEGLEGRFFNAPGSIGLNPVTFDPGEIREFEVLVQNGAKEDYDISVSIMTD